METRNILQCRVLVKKLLKKIKLSKKSYEVVFKTAKRPVFSPEEHPLGRLLHVKYLYY